jgi:hypothetical protein
MSVVPLTAKLVVNLHWFASVIPLVVATPVRVGLFVEKSTVVPAAKSTVVPDLPRVILEPFLFSID